MSIREQEIDLFDSNRFGRTLIDSILIDLHPLISNYYRYLLTNKEFNIPIYTPITINYLKFNDNHIITNYIVNNKYDHRVGKQVAMLRFELSGDLLIKPHDMHLWMRINDCDIPEEQFPIIKDGWGLITHDRTWTAKRLRDISVNKSVSILIELQRSYGKVWEFSLIKHKDDADIVFNHPSPVHSKFGTE